MGSNGTFEVGCEREGCAAMQRAYNEVYDEREKLASALFMLCPKSYLTRDVFIGDILNDEPNMKEWLLWARRTLAQIKR